MKKLSFILLIILLSSCKTYMEYTAGTDEVNYSYNNNKVKRYSNIVTALKDPDKVVFLDIDLTNDKKSEKIIELLNENIFKFTNLKKLTVLGNHTFKAPKNIFKLSSLEFLAVNSFDLDANIDLSQLKNLKFISLGDSRLQEIPPTLMQLTRLQGIDVTANQIRTIPESISNLSDLITIDLTNNYFSEVPNSLKKCLNLKYIDLNNAEGTDKEKLKTFHIGVNEIKTIGNLDDFKSLKELSLAWAYPDRVSLKEQYPHIKF